MICAEYRRELNHSYMIIKNTVPQLTQQYSYRMLRENRIRRLLSCQERIVDGESCLYFEISSRQTLDQFYEGRRMNALEIGQILQSIVWVQEDMGEYLLDGAGLLLEPACMFIDVETEELYFCFCPGWGNAQNPYAQLADFFLEHVDHGQETAVNLAYQFYKLSKAEYFVLSSFMPFVEKECAATEKTRSQEDVQMWIKPADSGTECALEEDKQGCADRIWDLQMPEKDFEEPYNEQKKESWFLRLFGRNWFQNKVAKRRGKHRKGERRNGRGSEVNTEYHEAERERSLWDVYADKLEQREEGETIYFSNLEKTAPKPTGRPFLVEVGGAKRFCLDALPVTVGKLVPKASIVLEDASVSRLHARFFSENEDIWLMDLNSRNGTMINEKKLAPNEAVKVEAGDEIRFGRERFQFTFIDSQKE